MALTVEALDPGRSLVLSGGAYRPDGPGGPVGPVGAGGPGSVPSAGGAEFTWAFIVRKHPDLTTRLIVRERYAVASRWSRLLLEPLSAVSSVMSQKMLRGIRDRAQASRVAAPVAAQ